MLKRILATVLMLILVVSVAGPYEVRAAKLPGAIWSLFEKEVALSETEDVQGLIDVRLEIIGLFDTWEDTSTQKLDIVTPRYQKIILGYESLLNYDPLPELLGTYIYYAGLQEVYGGWSHDAVLWAESKLKNTSFDVSLFAKTEDMSDSLYYGAKYEPISGVYFGAPYDLDTQVKGSAGYANYDWRYISKYYPKKNSAYLIYLEFGDEIKNFDRYYQQAASADTGIQLAWNTYETYDNMAIYDGYIRRTALYLENLGIPVFMRYGSEMNIASGMSDPQAYVENYLYIAKIFREIAPSVALVWSPNDVTESGRSLEAYYPGDAYVDWVGMSTYTHYYFGNKTDWGDQQTSIDNRFFTGSQANPLSKVKEVIETFGDRKPVMISESGVAHKSKIANEDMTEWASVQMLRQYVYMPLIYPQVKGIYYFNVDNPIATPTNSYALYTNTTIRDLYNELVGRDWFLSDIGSQASFRYKEVNLEGFTLEGAQLELMTYAVLPGELEARVVYLLNGQELGVKETIPYDISIDQTLLTQGTNQLRVEVYNLDGLMLKQANYEVALNDKTLSIVKEGSHTAVRDVGTDWSRAYVEALDQQGAMEGTVLYRPKATLAYDAVLELLTESNNVIVDDGIPLSGDIVLGGPLLTDSRQDMIAYMMTLAGYDGSIVTDGQIEAFENAFSDSYLVKERNVNALALAYSLGFIQGYVDGSLKPDQPMTRGEGAKVIYSTFY